MTKWVYSFGAGHNEGRADMRNLLGGKGANLAEMASIDLPVPPGFTITTELCTTFYDNGRKYPDELEGQVRDALALVDRVEQERRRVADVRPEEFAVRDVLVGEAVGVERLAAQRGEDAVLVRDDGAESRSQMIGVQQFLDADAVEAAELSDLIDFGRSFVPAAAGSLDLPVAVVDHVNAGTWGNNVQLSMMSAATPPTSPKTTANMSLSLDFLWIQPMFQH